MSTNQYQEMRNRQQAEINAFPMFFAFNKQQFAEGMRTLGLSLSDTCQMCSIFGGGYCRKSDAAKLGEMLARHRKELEDAISSDKTGKGFIFDMFLQELENHEYSYTGDVQEALDALGITPQYMEAMPQLMTGLSLACNKAMCIYVSKECMSDHHLAPEVYNDATAQVWRNGEWQTMEDTSCGALLPVEVIYEVPGPVEAAA